MRASPALRDRWRLPWPTASLRTFLVVVILLATVPIAALMSYQIFSDVKDQQQRLESSLGQSAAQLAQSVERELASSIDVLTLLAQSDAMQRGDLVRFEQELAAHPRLLRPSWSGAFVADSNGTLLFDNVPQGRSSDPAAAALRPTTAPPAPEFVRRLQGSEAAVSGQLIERLPGRYATAVVVPVMIDGVPRYALGAWLDAAVWQQMLERSKGPAGGFVSVFDRDHRIIARSQAHERFVGQQLPPSAIDAMRGRSSGFMRTEMLEGGALYAAWQVLAPSGWGVGVGVPAAPVDAVHQEAILAAVGTAAACLLLGVTLALWVARQLTQPLQQLAAQGAAQPFERIAVREISMLRDALLVAQAQDEVARERLRKKADEFETLFASSPLGLAFAQDSQCLQVLHNAAMTQLFGEPAAPGAAGEAVQVRYRGESLPPAQQPLQRAAARGDTITAMELELLRSGKPPRHVIVDAVPLRDERGRPRGAISAVVDISERKQVEARLLSTDRQLRESQHLMDLAQEAGHVGFFHYRFDTGQLTWTPGQAKLFGIDAPASLDPGSLDEWVRRIDPADRARVEATLRALLGAGGERETLEYRVLLAGGSARWLSSRVLLVSHAGEPQRPQQMIGVTVDMTEQYEAERERAALVEREQAARREAEAANRAKDEFLAMLGHELRNPLSAIASAVEVLNRVEAASDTAVNARSIIARQTRHVAHLMEDLLDVARVISGKVALSRHPVDLAALVQRAANTFDLTGAAREHPIDVRLREAWIDADATRIEQVVGNLLTNALRYTPAGGRIEIEVRREGGDSGAAVLEVRDSGIGIPPALLPRIFDLFVQGERPLDRRAGGLGIGLTLVRRLVELHGGAVGAASSAEGSVFTVRLPAIEAPAAAGNAPPREHARHVPESRRRRITLIEDNEDARDALRSMLELDGHSVSVAVDGPSGLQSLLQARPDVAVIDIGLPGITGFEVARRSRAAGYAGRMIALSGYGQGRDVQQALASGFDAHLVKPVDTDKLRQLLIDD